MSVLIHFMFLIDRLRASWAYAIQKGGAEVQRKLQSAQKFAKAVKLIGKVRVSIFVTHFATFHSSRSLLAHKIWQSFLMGVMPSARVCHAHESICSGLCLYLHDAYFTLACD